jgi:hypothetical protein
MREAPAATQIKAATIAETAGRRYAGEGEDRDAGVPFMAFIGKGGDPLPRAAPALR